MEHTPPSSSMLAGYNLVAIDDDGPVLYWRLEPPNSGEPILITVTPGGVTLRSGLTTWTSNVPLTNFVGELDTRYLAQKFLTKRWSPDAAGRHYALLLHKAAKAREDDPREPTHLGAGPTTSIGLDIFDSRANWEMDLGRWLNGLVKGLVIDMSERVPPLDFDDEETAYLDAIHDRFREAFLKAYRLEDGRPIRRGMG